MPKATAPKKAQKSIRKKADAAVQQRKREVVEEARPATTPQETAKQTDLTPRFKLVFIIATCITCVSGVAYLTLCIIFQQIDLTSRIQDAVETMKTVFVGGFGAIAGLLSGKFL